MCFHKFHHLHKHPLRFVDKRSVGFLELAEARLWTRFLVLHHIWLSLGKILTRFGTVGTILHRLERRLHRSPFPGIRVCPVETCGGFVPVGSFHHFHDLGYLWRLSESFLDFEKVSHPLVVADYNRSGEDNFLFLGVVGSLAGTTRNSDWVRVETSGYNFAAHGQLVHKSNKWVVPLVFAVLVVLRGYFDFAWLSHLFERLLGGQVPVSLP